MAYRKRIIKKATKEPDEFISTMEKVILFFEKNSRRIITVAVIVVVIVSALFALNLYKERKNEKAAGLEYQASRYYNGYEDKAGSSEGYKKSIELYEDLIRSYPKSKSTAIAQYNIGNAYFKMNEFDKAEEAYKKVLSKYSSNNILVGSVNLKLVYTYISKSDYDRAVEILNKILSDPSLYGKEIAFFELGKIYEAQHKKDEAAIKYESLIKDYPSSPWAAEASAKLKILKGEEKKKDKK